MRFASYKQAQTTDQKLLDVRTAMSRYSLGRASIMTLASEAESIMRIGRKPLINASKLDAYIDSMSIEE